jgi:ubiquinone/menaquinone biosynthesis C-methylase UbiE
MNTIQQKQKMLKSRTPNFHLLNEWAKKGLAYLHPQGKYGTSKLIKSLNLYSGMHVLELGCGTGATLADLHLISGLHLHGVDISPHMLHTAYQRLRFCRIQHDIHLQQICSGEKLPFPDACMDVIYAESVLAIVDEVLLPGLLIEIFRTLKPGGRFAAIDAIWKDECKVEQRDFINQRCLNHFGMVQSLTNPANKKDWQHLYEEIGFSIISTLDMSNGTSERSMHQINRCSSLFTQLKKLSILFRPWCWYNQIKAFVLIKKWHAQDGNYLKNFLFTVEKPDKIRNAASTFYSSNTK